MPHQWLEGNFPVNAKCSVCEKTCGSIRRLIDWRCLWCQGTVSLRTSLDSHPLFIIQNYSSDIHLDVTPILVSFHFGRRHLGNRSNDRSNGLCRPNTNVFIQLLYWRLEVRIAQSLLTECYSRISLNDFRLSFAVLIYTTQSFTCMTTALSNESSTLGHQPFLPSAITDHELRTTPHLLKSIL